MPKGEKIVEPLESNQLCRIKSQKIITMLILTVFSSFMCVLSTYALGSEGSFYEKLNLMYIPIIFFTVFTLFCITLGLVFALFWVLFNAE
jgi:hypothetical protein